ncbi:MAG: RluA family pseudouridine synthase [Thiohalorhabdus sp.]
MSNDAEGPKRQKGPGKGGPYWVEVTEGQDGQRVDNFLLGRLKGVPKTRIYRMLRKGEVRVNGKRCRPAVRLRAGDRVRIPPVAGREAPPAARVPEGARKAVTEAILFEDTELAVLNKPPGLAVHAGSGIPYGIVEALAAARPEVEWGLAHRLDRGTSGVLVVGKNGKATRRLQAAFRESRAKKAYLALLLGRVDEGEHVEEAPLRRGPERGGQRPMVVDGESGRRASTRFLVLRAFPGYTLVRAEPETGRTHQIRAHARHWGHPIAGDPLYGDREANRTLKELGLDSIFLHSAELELPHPVTGETQHFRAPLPAPLKALLDRLSG